MKNAFSFPEQSFLYKMIQNNLEKTANKPKKEINQKISTYFTPDGDGS